MLGKHRQPWGTEGGGHVSLRGATNVNKGGSSSNDGESLERGNEGNFVYGPGREREREESRTAERETEIPTSQTEVETKAGATDLVAGCAAGGEAAGQYWSCEGGSERRPRCKASLHRHALRLPHLGCEGTRNAFSYLGSKRHVRARRTMMEKF